MTKKDVYELINKKTKMIWNISISIFLTLLAGWFLFCIIDISKHSVKENEILSFTIFSIAMSFVILFWIFFVIKNILIVVFKITYRKNNEGTSVNKLASIILFMMFQFKKRKLLIEN
ncbi:hypothetical protein C4M96_00525 [Mycoplasmopsis pullorum]|uniref:hypothetical protein n=1 Tax=Mycoplasmopsis pullorum TaxID=48003 RepID=UPI00111A4800|nr:hypothetical protein [Mycoplasmopsis pullorum]TNK82751.1 hypothetical protein C4M93_03600 [Mycoplasmopsis pullorum]TNK92519.1 hypothetical protein C4M96_00525 [Mycoplasmopsis pullorum]